MALVILVAVMLLTAHPFHISMLLLPLLLLPLLLGLLGVSWGLAAMGVYLRDIAQIISPLTTGLMFLSPVFYPLSSVPEAHRWLIQLNPITYFLEAFRQLFLWGEMPDIGAWFISLLIGVVLFSIGFMTFQRLRRGFADVL